MREAAAWGAALILGFMVTVYFTRRDEPAVAPPAPAQARTEPAPASPPGAGPLAQGQALFERSCVACHGADGRGTRLGPPLVDSLYAPGRLSDDAFFLAVHRGVRQRNWKFGDMPPFTDVTPDEVRLIVAYVRDLQKKAGLF